MSRPFHTTVEETAAGWLVEARPEVGPRVRSANVWAIGAVPVCVTMAFVAGVASHGFPTLVAGGFAAALFLAAVTVPGFRWAIAATRYRVVCDGTAILFWAGGMRHIMVPVGDVLAVAVRAAGERYATVGLDVSIPGERLRPFAGRDLHTLDWLAVELRRRLNVPARTGDNTATTADPFQLVGRTRWGLLLAGLGIGVGLLCWSVPTFVRAEQSYRWPTTTGTVTAASWVPSGGRRQDDSATVEFRYTYRVAGQSYTGDGVGFYLDNPSAIVRDTVLAHPAGSAVPVRYQPDDPARGVIVPGPGPMLWGLLIVPLALIVLTLPLTLCWPTREQAVLVRRYARGLSAGPAVLPAAVLHRWRSPADVWEADRRRFRRERLWMPIRSTALTGAIVWVIWIWVRPYVSDMPVIQVRLLLFGLTIAPGVLFGFAAFATGLDQREPPEFQVTSAVLLLPRAKHPLVPWKRLLAFTVEVHPQLAHRRQLVLWQSDLPPTRRLPLPSEPQAETVMAAVAERLPAGSPVPTAVPPRGVGRRDLGGGGRPPWPQPVAPPRGLGAGTLRVDFDRRAVRRPRHVGRRLPVGPTVGGGTAHACLRSQRDRCIVICHILHMARRP